VLSWHRRRCRYTAHQQKTTALHAGVSRGIVALARRQRVSATSAMVLSPRWREDAAALRELRGTLDVGLHLDWTSRFALQAGHGLSLGAALLLGATLGFAPPGAVMARQPTPEQHQRPTTSTASARAAVDGIRQALVALVAQRYGPAAPYLRVSRPQRGLSDVKSQVIAAMGARGLQRLARGAGLGCASLLGGVYDFGGDAAAYALRMDGWLQAAPEGLLLMCHPADAPGTGDDVGGAFTNTRIWPVHPLPPNWRTTGWRWCAARGCMAAPQRLNAQKRPST
jgi:hypothetical protein